MRIPAASTEYIPVPVRVSGEPPGVTATVEMAIVDDAASEPNGVDWNAAIWDEDGQALLLIGPASPFGALAPNRYAVWVRVSAHPEVVVRLAGLIEIF
jgi:hypothetical protein